MTMSQTGPFLDVPSQPAFEKTMVVAEGVRGRRPPLPRKDWRRTDRENGTVGACPEVSHNGEWDSWCLSQSVPKKAGKTGEMM